jgi:hypothetical protein
VFPVFGAAKILRIVDVQDLDGFDRLLLASLQGLVNRERPEIYLIADPVDETWVPDLPVRTRTEKDPLSLLERYRDRFDGAVVYDMDVPDTINLATTIAGLKGAVVATAEQAEEHGLEIVEDLRDRFEDDSSTIHEWAMENLWPDCTDEILVGLPPTHTVEVEGVQWTELLREDEQVTDSSNHDAYKVDLSDQVSSADSTGTVYVRLSDSFPKDGWGPCVFAVEVTADGETIASFTPGTDDEEPFLFDAGGSQTGDGTRFADGGNSFVYAFEVAEGTESVIASLELENEFVVEATDQAPTQVEPFASFRDFPVATGALVSWLPPSGDSGSQFEELLGEVDPGTVYAGWFSDDVAGEWSGVELCSRAGVIVVAADFYMNATVLSGIRASTKDKPAKRGKGTPEDGTTYLTLTFGEGDNIQFCQRHMRELWDDEGRGQVPMNWSVSPLLEDIGPAILHHFQRTSTKNDLLVCGPSGAGYTYGDSWPQDEFDVFTALTGGYMKRTGLDSIFAYSTPATDGPPPALPDWVLASYAKNADLRGILQTDEKGDVSEPGAAVPLIGNLYPTGGVDEYLAGIEEKIATDGGDGPLFISGLINAWSWTPSDVVDLVDKLPDGVEVVLADEFFDLFAKTA